MVSSISSYSASQIRQLSIPSLATADVAALTANQMRELTTSQISQTTLRSVLGQKDLDDMLTDRESINQELQTIIDDHTDPWTRPETVLFVHGFTECTEAWRAWVGHQTMLINEYRLSTIDPKARKFLVEEMEKFLFGGGAEKPAGYVPPRV